MSMLAISRCGVALFFAVFVSGCSVMGSDDPVRVGGCEWNPSSCIYEGRYEPGERDYAEEEAKRLNRAASERFRRSAGG